MAGKYGPASVWLYVDGFILTAAKLQGLRHKETAEMDEDTGLGDSARERRGTGVVETEIAQEGAFFDTSTNNIHDAMGEAAAASFPGELTPATANRVICLGWAGQTAGVPFVGVEGAFSVMYDVIATRDGLHRANAEYIVDGASERGTLIQEKVTKTADFDTEAASIDYALDTGQQVVPITSNTRASPTVITTPVGHGLTSGDRVKITGVSSSDIDINFATSGVLVVTVISTTTFSVPINCTTSAGTGGVFVRADSSNGAVGFQQITAFSGFSAFVGKLRDSTDDVTFADLITFVDSPNIGGQRVTVSGQIDQFIAYKGDVTGSGSITVMCGIVRT